MSKKKVLIIDDNVLNIEVTADLLEKEGYDVLKALSGIEGLKIAKEKNPDIVLLDLVMPVIDGFETADQFKKQSKIRDIPIIFLTTGHIENYIKKAYAVGAVDYIMKPFSPNELLIRIKTQIELRQKQKLLEKSYQHVKRKNKKLNQLLIRDDLTKLYTRKYIIKHIEKEQLKFNSNKSIFSLIMVDIDYFKDINDDYGHNCGDKVLKAVARKLKESLRGDDILARWGGEEFLILLPETNLKDAKLIASHLLKDIRKSYFCYENLKLNVTISCGITLYNKTQKLDQLIKKADEKLYEAKRSGRNKICY